MEQKLSGQQVDQFLAESSLDAEIQQLELEKAKLLAEDAQLLQQEAQAVQQPAQSTTPTQQPQQAPSAPQEAPQNTPQVTQQGFDIGGALTDVAGGIGEAALLGAANAGIETFDGVYGLIDGAANLVGQDLQNLEIEPFKARTQTGQFLEPFARFGYGMLGAGKLLKVAGWAGQGGKFIQGLRAATQGGISDFSVFDENEERLSNLINQVPGLRNPVTEFLEAKPKDPVVLGRLKNVLEGAGAGLAVDTAIKGFTLLKNSKLIREIVGDKEAAEYLAESGSRGLDDLYPPAETRVTGQIVGQEQALPEVEMVAPSPELPPVETVKNAEASAEVFDDYLYAEEQYLNSLHKMKQLGVTVQAGENNISRVLDNVNKQVDEATQRVNEYNDLLTRNYPKEKADIIRGQKKDLEAKIRGLKLRQGRLQKAYDAYGESAQMLRLAKEGKPVTRAPEFKPVDFSQQLQQAAKDPMKVDLDGLHEKLNKMTLEEFTAAAQGLDQKTLDKLGGLFGCQ